MKLDKHLYKFYLNKWRTGFSQQPSKLLHCDQEIVLDVAEGGDVICELESGAERTDPHCMI